MNEAEVKKYMDHVHQMMNGLGFFTLLELEENKWKLDGTDYSFNVAVPGYAVPQMENGAGAFWFDEVNQEMIRFEELWTKLTPTQKEKFIFHFELFRRT